MSEENCEKTYAPSFWSETEEDVGKQVEQNIDQFNAELPELSFEVELHDNSIYEIKDWSAYALLMKYDWENIDEVIAAFRDEVQKHFNSKTEPSKFGTVKWGQSNHDDSQDQYESHSELAPVVLYTDIRSALMQICFIAMSDDEEDPVTVIGVDDDGDIHQYGKFGRVTFSNDE